MSRRRKRPGLQTTKIHRQGQTLVSVSNRLPEDKATSLDSWARGSIRIVEGSGARGVKSRPFNYATAVRAFTSWVYAAAKLNAYAVSSTRLRLYSRRAAPTGRRHLWDTREVNSYRKMYLVGDGHHCPSDTVMSKIAHLGSDFVEVVGPYPAMSLLRTFNPFMNGFDQTTLRVLYQQLTGNAYIHVITDSSTKIPIELWPMPPQWTWIQPDTTGGNFIKGYLYGQQSTKMVEFTPDEVIHFKYPNPHDLFYGMGRVEAAWSPININLANHNHDQALMDNHARPDYAIICRDGATDVALDRLETKISEMYRGSKNSGKFISLSGNMRVVPLAFPPKDLIGRDDVVEEIAACFDVPVSLLKANDPNLASAKTGFAVWHETSTLPLCRMDEETLNQTYLPLFGEDAVDSLIFAYDNPVPDDVQVTAEKNVAFVNAGIKTAEEVRIEERLPVEPIEGVLRVAGVPVDSLEGADPSATPLAPGLGEGVPRPTGDDPALASGSSKPGSFVRDAGVLLDKVLDSVTKIINDAATRQKEVDDHFSLPSLLKSIEKWSKLTDPKQKPARLPDETYDECVTRGVPILIEEGYSQEQAVAMAHEMCQLPSTGDSE